MIAYSLRQAMSACCWVSPVVLMRVGGRPGGPSLPMANGLEVEPVGLNKLVLVEPGALTPG
ncbi:MAG: hypothetical protein QM790_04350 [Nibricoccus sp.]